jgi:hypothetical protein
MAATPQGSAEEKLRGSLPPSAPAAPAAPAGVPQRWQNLAPGDNGAAHEPQTAPAKDAPQLEQNFPEALVWQAGQVVSPSDEGAGEAEGEVIADKVTRRMVGGWRGKGGGLCPALKLERRARLKT